MLAPNWCISASAALEVCKHLQASGKTSGAADLDMTMIMYKTATPLHKFKFKQNMWT